MDLLPQLGLDAAALEHFVNQPVDMEMIRYLAKAAASVTQYNPNMMPLPEQIARPRYPSYPREPSLRAVKASGGGLPTIEEFITQLVISSNVQVATLMSSLVYLRRLKSRLQPMAKSQLRDTNHRIFLASLILAAKYLNDSSPKNKHWAKYSIISTPAYEFGFSYTKVNLMEKQVLGLLDWDLRITKDNLYDVLHELLSPIRGNIQAQGHFCERRIPHQAKERLLPQPQAQTATASRACPLVFTHHKSPTAANNADNNCIQAKVLTNQQHHSVHKDIPMSPSVGVAGWQPYIPLLMLATAAEMASC